MTYNPEIHHRCSIRLKEYDYSQAGLYFITTCTQNRECLFGEIAGAEMNVNEYGKIVETVWNELPQHYPNVRLDKFVVMPNHIHGIIALTNVGAGFKPAQITKPTTIYPDAPIIYPASMMKTTAAIDNGAANHTIGNNNDNGINRAGFKPAPTESQKQHGLPEIVRALKTFSSQKINELRNVSGIAVWQRNYYEHIIRDEQSYQNLSYYIIHHPEK
jgi:REP element-mobilizing transposase RayT